MGGPFADSDQEAVLVAADLMDLADRTVSEILAAERTYSPAEATGTVYAALRASAPPWASDLALVGLTLATFLRHGHAVTMNVPDDAATFDRVHLAGLEGMADGVATCGATGFPASAQSPVDVTCEACLRAVHYHLEGP